MTLSAHLIHFKGNQANPFRVQLYLKESMRHTIDEDGNRENTPGNTYLFEQYVGNEVSLNYWIQKTINTLEIPELDNWKNSAYQRRYNRTQEQKEASTLCTSFFL